MRTRGVEFMVSIRIDVAELERRWTAGQIQALFAGLGRVLAQRPAADVRVDPAPGAAESPGAGDAQPAD